MNTEILGLFGFCALFLSITGLCFYFDIMFLGFISLILGTGAFIFGIIGLKQIAASNQD